MTNNKKIRTQLKVIGNTERHRFTGTFSRYGFKVAPYQSHAKPTLVLEDLRDETGKLVTDHLWLNLGLQFRRLGDLQTGDVIAFNGRVTSYVKGYQGSDPDKKKAAPRQTDYKVERPSKVALIKLGTPRTVVPLPENTWDLIVMIAERTGTTAFLPNRY